MIKTLVLTSMLAFGSVTFAQEAPKNNFHSECPVMSETQHNMRGPQFRGGPRGEGMRKEIQNCEQCKKHMKHMQKKHFKGKGPRGHGPMGHRGPEGKVPTQDISDKE